MAYVTRMIHLYNLFGANTFKLFTIVHARCININFNYIFFRLTITLKFLLKFIVSKPQVHSMSPFLQDQAHKFSV